MSKLFDDASLAMIPSAYKDGKLYSIRPTDGSGDFTFSRGSNLAATRVDVNGLIEKGRENLLLKSNQFDTTWVSLNTTETGGQAGYDGTNNAWLITKSAASARVYQTISVSGVQTYSVYAKAGTLNWVAVSNNLVYTYFDVANGVIGTNVGTIDSNIESVGGGWYRCSITYTGTAYDARIYPSQGDNNSNGTSGNIYIQDAQLELGLVATDYIETGASTAQAGILEDMPRLDYSGSCPSLLLEPERRNIVAHSEYLEGGFGLADFISVPLENITAPDGSGLVTKVQANGNSSGRAQDNLGTLTGNHIYSGFFKGTGVATRIRLRNNQGSEIQYDIDASGNFTLVYEDAVNDNYDIEDYGNGWYRIWFETATSPSTSNYFQIYADRLDGDGSVYAWGIQAEQGSYPTSYIPTYGTSQTRSVDSCLATSVSDLIGQEQGTLFIDSKVTGASTSFEVGCFSVSDGTNNNKVSILQYLNSDIIRITITTNGVNETDVSITKTRGLFHKIAVVYAENDCRIFIDGVKVSTDTSITLPSIPLTRVAYDIGYGAYKMNGAVKQSMLFPTALTDSECIALTS